MTQLRYLPDHKEIESDSTETILQASIRSQIPHAHACGGNARCSTCRVWIEEGLENCEPRNEKELVIAERMHFNPAIRLACQTKPIGNIVLRRLVVDSEDEELVIKHNSDRLFSMGEEKTIATLFADIRGFTSFSEKLPAYDVVHVLNRYFQQMGRAINRNGGDINNYIGDGLMALFGLDNPNDAAINAVRAALDMLEAVERLKPYLENVYTKSFEIGIGIHHGEAVIGAIGYDGAKRFTAIGDSVNFASRIESANKQAGTNLLISEETYKQVSDLVQTGKTVQVTLAGKSGEYRLYEVIRLKRPLD